MTTRASETDGVGEDERPEEQIENVHEDTDVHVEQSDDKQSDPQPGADAEEEEEPSTEINSIMVRDHDAEKEDLAINGELPAIAEEGVEQPQVVTTYMVVPPDGGWGWVVAAASFLSNLVVDGIIFSFGMYLSDMTESLGESKSTVSLIGALLAGFYLIVGPFVSALANRFGFRLVAVLGSVVGCFSFFISYFATSALYLCITYGILGGIGFGLIYVPAVITVGFYFERWRALATGVAVCGSGIGTFVMPPLITMLIREFGWRGSLLILAGLVFNCAIFGLVYRPLKPQKVTIQSVKGEGQEDTKDENGMKKTTEQLPLLTRIKMDRENQLHKSVSVASFADNVSVTAEKPLTQSRILKANNNNTYPTAAEALAGSTVQLNDSRQVSCHSLNVLGGGNLANNKAISGSLTLTKTEKRLSVPSYADNYVIPPTEMDNLSGSKETGGTELLLPSKEQNHNSHYNMDEVQKEGLQKRNSRTRTISECSRNSLRSRKGIASSRDNVGVRPLYRDDIFFGGSLQRIPQYTSQNSIAYHMSVSRLPTKADVEQERKNECIICPEAVQRILATMLDVSLLKSPSFLLLSLSGFITMMGFYIPFMFITDRARLNGMDEGLAVFLVSVIGITNTVGRVGCGVLTSFPGVDSLLINNVALTIGGIATMLSGVDNSSGYQFTYASIFGLSMACFASLRSIIIVDLLGLDKLTNAFGLLLLFQGIAATIGSPLAGAFMEATGSYDASFYLSGGLILFSAIIIFPLNKVNKWEKQRAKCKEEQLL